MKIVTGKTKEIKKLPDPIEIASLDLSLVEVNKSGKEIMHYALSTSSKEMGETGNLSYLQKDVSYKESVFVQGLMLNRLDSISRLLDSLNTIEDNMRDKITEGVSASALVKFHESILVRLEKELNFYNTLNKDKETSLPSLSFTQNIDNRSISGQSNNKAITVEQSTLPPDARKKLRASVNSVLSIMQDEEKDFN